MHTDPPCSEWAEKLALRNDDLSPSDRSALKRHLMTCPACASASADYAFLANHLRSLSAPVMKPFPRLSQEFVDREAEIRSAKALRRRISPLVPVPFKQVVPATTGFLRRSMKGALIGIAITLMLFASFMLSLQVQFAPGPSHPYTNTLSASVVWSSGELQIASPSISRTVQVWSTITGRHIFTFHGYTGAMSAVVWSPDGKRIASADTDQTVQIWNALTGAHLLTYYGHNGAVSAVAWSPDGKWIASAGTDQTVQVWNALTGAHLLTYRGHTGAVLTVAWSPDGLQIASESTDQTVQVWDVITGGESNLFMLSH